MMRRLKTRELICSPPPPFNFFSSLSDTRVSLRNAVDVDALSCLPTIDVTRDTNIHHSPPPSRRYSRRDGCERDDRAGSLLIRNNCEIELGDRGRRAIVVT